MEGVYIFENFQAFGLFANFFIPRLIEGCSQIFDSNDYVAETSSNHENGNTHFVQKKTEAEPLGKK
jgi:hypothetical protein